MLIKCTSSSHARVTASLPHHCISFASVLTFESYSPSLCWKSVDMIHTLPSPVYRAMYLPFGLTLMWWNGPLSRPRSSASDASTKYMVLSMARRTSTLRDIEVDGDMIAHDVTGWSGGVARS